MQCLLSCLYGLLPLPVDRENKVSEIGLDSEETPAYHGKQWWAERFVFYGRSCSGRNGFGLKGKSFGEVYNHREQNKLFLLTTPALMTRCSLRYTRSKSLFLMVPLLSQECLSVLWFLCVFFIYLLPFSLAM